MTSDPVGQRRVGGAFSKGEVMAMSQPSSGFLGNGIPYLAIGEGLPLVKVEGLTPTHDVPTGWMRRMYVSTIAPLSGEFRVYWVNRKKGLQPGESMSDIAGHLASAIEEEFGEPVFLTGESTGGSVVLQLAVDRPELVRSLVVVAAACRLGEQGRLLQAGSPVRCERGTTPVGWPSWRPR